jgi:uncharacterized protein with PQ loop repeat
MSYMYSRILFAPGAYTYLTHSSLVYIIAIHQVITTRKPIHLFNPLYIPKTLVHHLDEIPLVIVFSILVKFVSLKA